MKFSPFARQSFELYTTKKSDLQYYFKTYSINFNKVIYYEAAQVFIFLNLNLNFIL